MGRIVVTEFISLDGIVEDPGGTEAGAPADWTTFDRGAEGDQLKLAELNAADAQLLGRVTYDGFAAAWPGIEDEAGFAAKNEPDAEVCRVQDPAQPNVHGTLRRAGHRDHGAQGQGRALRRRDAGVLGDPASACTCGCLVPAGQGPAAVRRPAGGKPLWPGLVVGRGA
jgi:hypothetical protein